MSPLRMDMFWKESIRVTDGSVARAGRRRGLAADDMLEEIQRATERAQNAITSQAMSQCSSGRYDSRFCTDRAAVGATWQQAATVQRTVWLLLAEATCWLVGWL